MCGKHTWLPIKPKHQPKWIFIILYIYYKSHIIFKSFYNFTCPRNNTQLVMSSPTLSTFNADRGGMGVAGVHSQNNKIMYTSYRPRDQCMVLITNGSLKDFRHHEMTPKSQVLNCYSTDSRSLQRLIDGLPWYMHSCNRSGLIELLITIACPQSTSSGARRASFRTTRALHSTGGVRGLIGTALRLVSLQVPKHRFKSYQWHQNTWL